MRKLTTLKERLTSRAAERRKNRILERKWDEERRFTLAWARERQIPDRFKESKIVGATKETQQSVFSKLTSFLSLRRAS